MDTTIRKSFQGIGNVVKFNWHFYVLALILLIVLLTSTLFINSNYTIYCFVMAAVVFIPTFISLLVTYYIYDYSDIYEIEYLNELNISQEDKLVNIHAGFDEFSFAIAEKFKTQNLSVFDFYNPKKHTEISIERARKVSSVFPNTQSIETSTIRLEPESVATIFVLFSAHEIRNLQERIVFFKQMEKALHKNGQIIVMEHLRDLPNFIAYTIGFFHFLSKSEWEKTFQYSNLSIQKEMKITPFISVFILQKNGITS
ncbi:MAG: methyltransferase [Flavobacterium sp.]